MEVVGAGQWHRRPTLAAAALERHQLTPLPGAAVGVETEEEKSDGAR